MYMFVRKNIFSFILGMYLEVGLLSHMLTLCLTIWEATSLFHSTAPFYILPAMYEDPNLSKALLKIGILFLIFHHYYSQNVKWYLMWVFFFKEPQLNFILFYFYFFNFTILYWFCHISKWIHHRCTCVPHPEPSSLLPPHTIPLGHPSAPAPSIQYRTSNLDWQLISYMIFYMFQCHSPKSSHPLPLSQSP